MPSTTLIHGIRRLYTLNPKLEGLGVIEYASILMEGDCVVRLGPSDEAPEAEKIIDACGLIGVPGLVDPHTH